MRWYGLLPKMTSAPNCDIINQIDKEVSDMWENIAAFMRNDIVTLWIVPIIGTIIVVLAIKLITDRYKSKAIINIIRIANSRFVDAVRPFFIQEIEIDRKIINNIRNAVKREYCADDNMLYTIEQLEEQIILDISESKYLTEARKQELIHNIYDKFDHFKREEPFYKEEEQTQLIKEEIWKLKNSNYRLITIFLLIILMSILLLINYLYTLDFSNLYWMIILLPMVLFIVEMISDSLTGSRERRLKKKVIESSGEKNELKLNA